MRSDSSSIQAAVGTATRQAQYLQNILSLGTSGMRVADNTFFDISTSVERQDFLGEFTIDSDEDADTIDEGGSDFWRYTLLGSLQHDVSQQLQIGLNARTNFLDFTDIESNDLDGDSGAIELDRWESQITANSEYLFSDKFQVHASVGIEFSNIEDSFADQMLTIIDAGGNPITLRNELDDDQVTLIYRAGFNYSFSEHSSLTSEVGQSRGTDTDGDRVSVRYVTLNGAQKLGDRADLLASFRYARFNQSDSLNNGNNRYEVVTAFKYSLSKTLAISLGWNFVRQDDTEDMLNPFFFANDYRVNRAFISLNGGFIGTTL